MVKLHTNHGIITLELDAEKAPKTVENFLQYVRDGFFDGTIFHRIIDGFMIQGGGFEPGMTQKPTRATIENEAGNGLKNEAYTVAMARTNDPNSATAQFFINVANNSFLNHTAPTPQGYGYAVFGKVVEGMDVVDKLKKIKTGNRAGHQDVPWKTSSLPKPKSPNIPSEYRSHLTLLPTCTSPTNARSPPGVFFAFWMKKWPARTHSISWVIYSRPGSATTTTSRLRTTLRASSNHWRMQARRYFSCTATVISCWPNVTLHGPAWRLSPTRSESIYMAHPRY